AILGGHPGAREAVVIASDEELGNKRLMAFIVPNFEREDGGLTELSVKNLRVYLRERLPDYMIPTKFTIVDSIPLTPNGKIDRRRLSELEDGSMPLGPELVAPRTAVEEILVGIFEDVLKLDRVGIYDDFFEIGGHSLLATQVMSRVSNTFGVEIGVRTVLEEATIKGLSRRIEEEMRAGNKK